MEMNCSFVLRAVAVAVVVAVLAATAGASTFVSAVAPLPSDLLWSPPFLWIAANVIVIWLVFSSFRHHRTVDVVVSSSSAIDILFPSSEHDVVFSAAPDAVVVAPARKRSAGEDKRPSAVVEAEVNTGGEREHIEEKSLITAAAASEADPDGPATDDVSMDSAWQSIVRSGVARPVAVRKSETWSGEELPRMRRAADKAVATPTRKEMRKSASMIPPSPHPTASPGWRTRDVLVMAHDELLRRAESFIRRQHEHLRIQRQESDDQRLQMAAMDQRDRLVRVPAPAPIGV